ncbi:MAG: hypothetical protein ACQETH_11360 [Candidatus Rifleibacteriota bacterium]
MRQILVQARLFLVATFRSSLLYSFLIVAFPLFFAAYLFDITNPGFQTLFIKDIVASILSVFSMVIVILLAFEAILWKDGKNKGWFLLSRIKNRLNLFVGQTLGMMLSVLFILGTITFFYLIILRFTHGVWFWELIAAVWLLGLEAALAMSLLNLLATMCSRFLSLSVFFLLYLVSITQLLPSFMLNHGNSSAMAVLAFILSVLPDFNMFSLNEIVFATESFSQIVFSTIYAFFMSGFYLLLAEAFFAKRGR